MTTYGERSPDAPRELGVFSFLVVLAEAGQRWRWIGSREWAGCYRDFTIAVVCERYLLADADNFVYRLDVSDDGGTSWKEGQIEMTFRRPASPRLG